MVGLARGGDHLRASGHRQLDGGRSHPAGTTVDEHGVPGLDVEQAKTAFGGLAGHARRGGHSPVDGRRLGGPRVENRELCLGVTAPAQHVITHGHTRDPLADLVNDPGGVEAEIARAVQGLSTGQDPGQHLPVDWVDAGRTHGDPNLPGARVRVRSVRPPEHLGTPVRRELQRSHQIVLPGRRGRPLWGDQAPTSESALVKNQAWPGLSYSLDSRTRPARTVPH